MTSKTHDSNGPDNDIRSLLLKVFNRRVWGKVLKWGLVLSTLVLLAGAGALVGLFMYHGSDSQLTSLTRVKNYKPFVVTRILSSDGHLIAEVFTQRRTVVSMDKIPEVLIQATIAAEDARFFKHKGMDKLGMIRAFLANLRAGRYVQGGSTITQQLVKTLFLTPRRTLKRKVQELILARRIEQSLSKREILSIYLNQVYYGHGRYGVEEASRFLFGKGVHKLSLSDASILAGLPQNPENLSPIRNPRAAKRRQRYVLRRMAELGFISEEKAKEVEAEPIKVMGKKHPYLGSCPEIADMAVEQLKKRYGARNLYRLGLTVVTSCDVRLQKMAVRAVENGLAPLDLRQLRRSRKVPAARRAELLKGWEKRRKGPIKNNETYRALVKELLTDGTSLVDLGGYEAVLTEWPRENARRFRQKRNLRSRQARQARLEPGMVVWVRKQKGKWNGRNLVTWDWPQVAMVVIDPATRMVKAMVGGRHFQSGEFNRAVSAVRQPGSAFKPILYSAALASRRYTPSSIVLDSPEVFRNWKPRNSGQKEFLGPVRLRVALAKSLNTVAVKLLDDVGIENVKKTALDMGIRSSLSSNLSLALGSSGVTPMELANAYTTIASGGEYERCRYILSIQGLDPEGTRRPKRPLDRSVAYVITSMMQSVIREGTARRARILRRPLAGKTGSTNEHKDAWFVGFSPDLVAAVWVGHDDFKKRSLGRGETGSRAALPVWMAFMREALKNSPVASFTQPPDVVTKSIDPVSGLLAPPGMEKALAEVFVKGTEPTQSARLVKEVDPSEMMMQAADTPGTKVPGQGSRPARNALGSGHKPDKTASAPPPGR